MSTVAFLSSCPLTFSCPYSAHLFHSLIALHSTYTPAFLLQTFYVSRMCIYSLDLLAFVYLHSLPDTQQNIFPVIICGKSKRILAAYTTLSCIIDTSPLAKTVYKYMGYYCMLFRLNIFADSVYST